MKSKKNNLTTGIIIGIGLIVVPLILMGTNYTTEKQNKYEFHQGGQSAVQGFLLNSETGETWYINQKTKIKHN